ncbi:LysE family translocator [Lactococcus nasutitermitis]|uniref:LysE family translocator n=1 Tax=Lactococcus nasutitermitis TaxID=1652957 RepID=A0ABV9JHH3_9LACT|nr:LysE family transporter [Lactococcus nasutitermitis]
MTQTLFTYIIACIFIICVPGPSVTFLITTSIEQGKSAAYRIIPGTFLGDLSAMTLSFVGLTALIHVFPNFNLVLKYLGGIILIYLGFLKFTKIENLKQLSHKIQVHFFYQVFYSLSSILKQLSSLQALFHSLLLKMLMFSCNLSF